MSLAEILTVAGIVIAYSSFLFGMWRYFESLIASVKKDNEERTARVYERFDEHKKAMEEKYVRKDMCQVMHNNSIETFIAEVKRIALRFDKLEERVEIYFKQILEKMDGK